MKSKRNTKIGFIGLGNMGSRMAKNLYDAGYPLIGNDIDESKCTALAEIGAKTTSDTTQVVKECDVVMTSLRSSDVFFNVAETYFLPNAEDAQIFIDLGTSEVGKTQELATDLSKKGSILIDAPVSGGPHGSETGTLRIFVGGDAQAVEKCRPILEVLGEPKFVVYCGPSGSGQIVKGVNQLAMGLGAAAYMEAMAFGVCAGVDPIAIRKAIGMGDSWRGEFDRIAKRIIDGAGKRLVVKYPELPYFLAEAEASGFEIPLTKALYEFCKKGSYEMLDNMNRQSRSFWHELTKDSDTE
ncbi:MAG: NAD(P)-dependent oxidoreductase [Candidatus Poribacteria bacterium]|nr:NAD(P)-dependent oxidoreductase [Candidatus Poribacteria bacterium]